VCIPIYALSHMGPASPARVAGWAGWATAQGTVDRWLYDYNQRSTVPCMSPNPIDVLLHIDPLYQAVSYHEYAGW